MAKVILVYSCNDCPFRGWQMYDGVICQMMLISLDDPKKIPEWCPLEDDEA